MKAQVCPVCGGSGKYWRPRDPNEYDVGGEGEPATCHGCGGLGWVSVPEDHLDYLPPDVLDDSRK